jgi:Nitrile hydratase beta subunit, N-terminal
VDGVHDLGGLDGFGPVEHEVTEPLFAQDWERRVFRVLIGSIGWMGGAAALESMVVDLELTTPAELDAAAPTERAPL